MKNHIRSLRQRRGLTLKELADDLQTTPQSISRLETGNMTLSVDWLQRFASALRVHPTDLLESAQGNAIPIVGCLGGNGSFRKFLDKKFNLTVNIKNPMAVEISQDIGVYNAGDTLIIDQIPLTDLSMASGRDCLMQTLTGEVFLGRLIAVSHAVKRQVGALDTGQSSLTSYFLSPLIPNAHGKNATIPLEDNILWVGPIMMRVSYF